jgi:hypothetical protein
MYVAVSVRGRELLDALYTRSDFPPSTRRFFRDALTLGNVCMQVHATVACTQLFVIDIIFTHSVLTSKRDSV